MRTIHSGGLFEAWGTRSVADYVRKRTAGQIQLLTGLYIARGSRRQL